MMGNPFANTLHVQEHRIKQWHNLGRNIQVIKIMKYQTPGMEELQKNFNEKNKLLPFYL